MHIKLIVLGALAPLSKSTKGQRISWTQQRHMIRAQLAHRLRIGSAQINYVCHALALNIISLIVIACLLYFFFVPFFPSFLWYLPHTGKASQKQLITSESTPEASKSIPRAKNIPSRELSIDIYWSISKSEFDVLFVSLVAKCIRAQEVIGVLTKTRSNKQ